MCVFVGVCVHAWVMCENYFCYNNIHIVNALCSDITGC